MYINIEIVQLCSFMVCVKMWSGMLLTDLLVILYF